MNFRHGGACVCGGLGAFCARTGLDPGAEAGERGGTRPARPCCRGGLTRLAPGHEPHQRARRGVSRGGIPLDVARIRPLNCPAEASPGRRADLPEGGQREGEPQRQALSCGRTTPGLAPVAPGWEWGGVLGELRINQAHPGPARAGGRGCTDCPPVTRMLFQGPPPRRLAPP